jgi:hypothetical protein
MAEEVQVHRRRLAAANPAAFEPVLVRIVRNLSPELDHFQRYEEAATGSPAHPGDRRSGVRGRAADAGLQDRMERRDADGGGPVVSVVEDLLGLRPCESQAGPVRADLPVRAVRSGPGPGHQRRPEPAVPRRWLRHGR